MNITLSSTRFGDVEIADDAVIEFADGLIGLGGTRYALLATSPDTAFLWLHSLDHGGLALPVTNPHQFFPNFRLEMLVEDAERFNIDAQTKVDVYVTIRAMGDVGLGRPSGFVANQRAPIVIHGGQGMQVINQAPGMELRAPLPMAANADRQEIAASAREASKTAA
jgi:flagellar assembly factor FliW